MQTFLAFDPERYNPARKSHFGVWRVVGSVDYDDPVSAIGIGVSVLRISTTRSYQRGTIVSPVKMALEYLHREQGNENEEGLLLEKQRG